MTLRQLSGQRLQVQARSRHSHTVASGQVGPNDLVARLVERAQRVLQVGGAAIEMWTEHTW